MSREILTEKPILFSAPMVRAILAGTKTQTRRVIKVRGETYPGRRWWVGPHPHGGWWAVDDPDGPGNIVPSKDGGFHCPYPVGTRLWVREKWMKAECPSAMRGAPQVMRGPETSIGWQRCAWHEGASDPGAWPQRIGWRPSISMPRWASRIALEIAEVRVQQVQKISMADARAEGVTNYRGKWADGTPVVGGPYNDPIDAFSHLWDSINGKRPGCAWADNPWVWAITFKRVSP